MYGMNQGYNAPDPSAQVPNHLLPHVHLISSYRFPTLPSLQPAEALEYLIKGPQIVRDTSPVAWTYLDSPPPDGSVLLAFQPPRMGTQLASDGMVWADAETTYDINVRGYTLQVLIHNSGYYYPHEPYATHARYRYRILAGPGTTNPSLWLIHYRPAEPQHRISANQIPLQRPVHEQLQMRQQLHAAGPLMRKEFMLHDQANWPKVEFGQQVMRPQQPYYNPMQPGRPYPTQQPPSKRARLPPQSQARMNPASSAIVDTSLEEEENATQDAFDFLTPREISLSRYKQHHEWMEEIFSSPYAVGKITPIDLGLGLMGELAPLTAGILDVPGVESAEGVKDAKEVNKIKSYNKLEPSQLKEFEKRVSEHVAKEQGEIDKMKAEHARKVAQLKRTRTYIKAERRLRDLSRTVEVHGEGHDAVEEVVGDVEKSLNVSFEAKKPVVCVEKGGFIEGQASSPAKAQVNGSGAQSSNGASHGMSGAELDNSAASLLDQYGSGSVSGTPMGHVSLPRLSQPHSQSHSAMGTPNATGNLAQATTFDSHGASLGAEAGDDLLDLDVEMSGMPSIGDKGDGWGLAEEPSGGGPSSGNAGLSVSSGNAATSHGGTMASHQVDGDAGSMFDSADFGSFDNLDTAGDALAEYGNDDGMGLDLVDDSAFGDAFHGTEMHHDETGE
ncbi:hypothetical protein ACEQ8H_001114 [Pleosporales sp. CAS-2024a]